METIIDQGKTAGLERLTSEFYTLIPHSFGRQRPGVINTREVLQLKMDMLTVSESDTLTKFALLSSMVVSIFM